MITCLWCMPLHGILLYASYKRAMTSPFFANAHTTAVLQVDSILVHNNDVYIHPRTTSSYQVNISAVVLYPNAVARVPHHVLFFWQISRRDKLKHSTAARSVSLNQPPKPSPRPTTPHLLESAERQPGRVELFPPRTLAVVGATATPALPSERPRRALSLPNRHQPVLAGPGPRPRP